MTNPRFGKLIVLACMGLAVACTGGTEGGTVGNTELNLDIVNPSGTSGELGFAIDRVNYRITCDGNPGAAIAPETYVGSPPDYTPCSLDADCGAGEFCSTSDDAAAIGDPSAGLCAIPVTYDDSVDINGQFEVVDSRTPPVWQAVMDLPPGDCTSTLTVRDTNGEIVCAGSDTLLINEDGTTKYDIVLVCSLSVDLPDGMADIDGEFLFVTGNLCPKTYTLNAIPSEVDILSIPPLTEIQFRASDPDDGCGSNCDPQICNGANPPVCNPSVYNPNDARCLAAAGGGLTCGDNNPLGPAFCPLCAAGNPFGLTDTSPNPCCVGGDFSAGGGPVIPPAEGTVCSVTALPTATPGVPGGTFLNPLSGDAVGPFIPVNISDVFNDGTGIAIQGTDIDYICDPTIPGNVNMLLSCSDGDEQCDSSKAITVNCPGINFCDEVAVDCSAPAGSCISGGTCIVACDPADIQNPPCTGPAGFERCDGYGGAVADETECTVSGGNVCVGGSCVTCTTTQDQGKCLLAGGLLGADCEVGPAGNAACPVAGSTGGGICLATNPNCDSTPIDCQRPADCTGGNTCTAPLPGSLPPGAPCSNGECDAAGVCQFVAIDPPAVTKVITLGCANNLTADISVLPWELTADADEAVDGNPVEISYTGVAIFTEGFLDSGLAAVPGLNKAALAPGNRGGATIVPQTGLSGGDLRLEIEPAPVATTCAGGMNDGDPCNVLNNVADVNPTTGLPGNTDCPAVPYGACLEVIQIPTIDGTLDACAACDALGTPKNTQCAANGFCIAPGGLPIQLDTVTGNYDAAVANAEGIRIGWDTTNQDGLDANGAYIIPVAPFSDPWQPGGLRVIVGILQISLNCVMGIPAGLDNAPPLDGIPDQAGPTPITDLLQIGVQVP